MASSEEVNIPQKPPMVMVDRILEISGEETVTAFRIKPDNILCENGFFSEAGLIENMAQTAAAGAGAGIREGGGEPPVGFIGGIKNLRIFALPLEGTEIRTRVKVLHRIMEASVVQGEVWQDQQLLASCELKIFLATRLS